jgi:hypothetical protein
LLLYPFLGKWTFSDHEKLEDFIQGNRVDGIRELWVVVKSKFEDEPESAVDSLPVDGLEELQHIIQISLIKHSLYFCLAAILLFCIFSIIVSSLLALALVGQKI